MSAELIHAGSAASQPALIVSMAFLFSDMHFVSMLQFQCVGVMPTITVQVGNCAILLVSHIRDPRRPQSYPQNC